MAGTYDVHYTALDTVGCAAAWDNVLAYRASAATPAARKSRKGK